MDNIALKQLWQSQNEKIDNLLSINKKIAVELAREKISKQLGKLYQPKLTAIFIGVPYTLLLVGITIIAFMAKAYFVTTGFGAISLIMMGLLGKYCYQLYLINKLRHNDEVISTQEQLSKLQLSSYQSVILAVFQLPFWALCWISLDALIESPLVYGGVNVLIFSLLTYLSYWLHKRLSPTHPDSKIRDFFFSGSEWEPIVKSAAILEQIKEYEQ
jgi:hypothetical protein